MSSNVSLSNEELNSADPQSLIRSLLNSFPIDLNFSDDINISDTDSITIENNNNDDSSDILSGIITPIGHEDSMSVSTPTLSLPESFDHGGDNIDKKSNKKTSIPSAAKFPNLVNNQILRQTIQHQLPRCQRCAETEQLAAKEKEIFRVQAVDAKKQLEIVRMDHDAQKVELLRLQKLSGITEENQRLEISALKDRCERLNAMLESESVVRRANEEKASKFDMADSELQKLRRETADLKLTMEQQSAAVSALRQSEDTARRAAEDNARVKDMLQMDKAHLQQEVRTLEARLEEKTRAAEASHSQALALEVKVAQLTDQLLTLQLTARSGFDERMDKEIQRLREDSQREISAMKETSKDILDRENRVLREAKVSMENECNQLRQRNDSLSQQLTAFQTEMSNVHHEKNSVISELRAEVKMKGFELTQLGVSFEERMAQLRQGELEIDVLRQELTAHKSAIQRLESESESKLQKLQAELEQTQRRLQAYEGLEEQIDEAVMRTAKLNPQRNKLGQNIDEDTDGQDLIENVEQSTKRLLQSVKGIPVNPERRVRQAVYLAQKLLDTERQRDDYKAEVAQLRKDLQEALKQAEIAHENLSRAAQPTSYLVGKLREEELAKAAFINKCKVLENELSKRKKAELEALKDAQLLRERLSNLLRQRGELETVKVMLEQLHAIEEESDSEDEESHYQDEPHISDKPNSSQSPATPTRTGPSEEQKSPFQSPGNKNVADDSPESKVAASAIALGLSPELVQQLTSPPRADEIEGISNPPNSAVSFRREALQ